MKNALWVSVFMLAAIAAGAQSFNAGIRAGISGTQVNGDRLSGFNKIGIVAGGFVSRNLSEKTALQMEIVYIQKGSRKPTDDNNFYYRMRVHYVEVPVLFIYKTSKKFAITAGPSFGTLIFSAENDQFGVYRNTLPFKKFELSGNVGIQYKLGDNWTFDGRYSQSITTIRPYPGAYSTFFDRGQYNVLIEFSLLYAF
jgi:hypothetical protein